MCATQNDERQRYMTAFSGQYGAEHDRHVQICPAFFTSLDGGRKIDFPNDLLRACDTGLNTARCRTTTHCLLTAALLLSLAALVCDR